MRLLFLAPFAPRLDATHGGGRAIAELLVHLAPRHSRALLYLRGAGEPAVDAPVRGACEFVQEVERPEGRGLGHRAKLAAGLMRGEPMWVIGWRVPALAATLRRLAADWQPDVVQAEYHVMGQYLAELRPGKIPRVLRQHEPGAAAADDRATARRGLRRWVSGADRHAWRRYEAAVLRQAEAVVTFTERDAAALRALAPAAQIRCIPLATPLPDRPLHPAGSGEPILLFVGNFAHPPNADAAARLARDIFPRVRTARPETALYIVGPDPTGDVSKLAGLGVTVTGEVRDVLPFLDRAAVVVVPLRLGGGMRVKVMEALAAGKALVASPLAVEGMAVRDGEHVALANTDDEFAAQTVALLSDADRRAALASAARAWAVANLGWAHRLTAFESLYASLVTA